MVLGRDFELREYVYKEKMYLFLITILLEDSLCFLLNFYMVFCKSPESVEKPMFHLASWQTLALTSSLMSIVVAFGRLLCLNYHYCRIFGCFSSGCEISSCCVWTNTVFAYFVLAVMFYFFFGQFLPKIISYKVRQAKRALEGSQNIVPIVKNFMFEIHDVYRHFSKSQSRTRKQKKPCFVEFIRAIS